MKIILLLFSIFYLLFAIGNAWAQELGISIDPPIIQIDTNTPANINAPIKIKNESDQSVTYNIFLKPFRQAGTKNGEPDYFNNLPNRYKEFFRKVQISDQNQPMTQLRLGPSETKELALKINIPKGEPPNDYYFSVVFISEESKDTRQINFLGAQAGIGTNVLLSIGPKSKTQGHISQFQAPRFVTHGPVKFRLEIANTSSHYSSINGNIVIKNMFGQTVANIDLPSVNILANSSRSIPVVWDEKFLLGFYQAEISTVLSDEGPLLKKSVSFFAFPLEAVFAILATSVLLVGMMRRARMVSSDRAG